MRLGMFAFVSTVTAFLAVLLVLPPGNAAGDESPDKIIKSVQKTVESLRTLSCLFEQEHFLKAMDRKRTISGAIQVKEPNRLRVEYPAQTIVVDGETVWWYIVKNLQVTVQDFEEGEGMFPTPHNIFRRYIADENIRGKAVFEGESKINGSKCYILRLAGGSEAKSDVTVWIDGKLNFPVKSVEEKANGDRITYVLKDVKINKKIDDDTFTFDVPEGVSVVDMR